MSSDMLESPDEGMERDKKYTPLELMFINNLEFTKEFPLYTGVIPDFIDLFEETTLLSDPTDDHSTQMKQIESTMNLITYLFRGAKYPSIDFDSPPVQWTKWQRVTFRAELYEMSKENMSMHFIDQIAKVSNRSCTSRLKVPFYQIVLETLIRHLYLIPDKSLRDVALPINMEDNYDWKRVSKAIHGAHTPLECQEYWYTRVHPHINSRSWRKQENRALARLAYKHNLCGWDAIAEELSTGRTGFQCWVHFNRNLKKRYAQRKEASESAARADPGHQGQSSTSAEGSS